jgi:hypothetical protein
LCPCYSAILACYRLMLNGSSVRAPCLIFFFNRRGGLHSAICQSFINFMRRPPTIAGSESAPLYLLGLTQSLRNWHLRFKECPRTMTIGCLHCGSLNRDRSRIAILPRWELKGSPKEGRKKLFSQKDICSNQR